MEQVIDAIMQANEDEIEKIIRTAIHRKRELYPDWEITYQANLRHEAGNDNILRKADKHPPGEYRNG